MKEGALNRTLWRNRFGGGIGPVIRQTAENERRSIRDIYIMISCCSASQATTPYNFLCQSIIKFGTTV